mmetsp:Transcript_27680/g.38130  ORF Transcript_27680/g.38130 Transcript_27680/m.38130 type:complete len:141 (-) Transcript_27680:82-504(-)
MYVIGIIGCLFLFMIKANQVLSLNAPSTRLNYAHAKNKLFLSKDPEESAKKNIVVRKATDEELSRLRVKQWPTWGCEISRFPWTYSDTETCFILKGRALIIPKDESPSVEISVGDLCTFPEGLSCIWDVKEAISKHYYFN